MDERERIKIWNDREDLIDEVKATFGAEPANLRRVLAALSHPEVLQFTKQFFESLGDTHTCLHYDAPWNCATVTESNYESMIVEAGGPGSTTIFDQWCVPCRDRAMNKRPTWRGEE